MKLAKLLIAVLMLASVTVSAQTTVMPTTYSWTAPTTGSPVHHYIVSLKAGEAAWVTVGTPTAPTYMVPCVPGVVNIVRVQGVDSAGRIGLWSDPSLDYTPDAGAPGACGKPARQP
jgi:hypothetical protein